MQIPCETTEKSSLEFNKNRIQKVQANSINKTFSRTIAEIHKI